MKTVSKQKIESETFWDSQNHKKTWNSTLVPRPSKYQEILKPKKIFFLVFLLEFQLYFTRFLKFYVTVLLSRIYLILNNEEKVPYVFSLQFYEPPDSEKKTFTTWNVLKSEVYLTCINFWKFHDDLKACLEVIRLTLWPENVKFSAEIQFFTFLTPLKHPFLY